MVLPVEESNKVIHGCGTVDPSLPYIPAADKASKEVMNGYSLFQENCQQCHAMHEQTVGPALKFVHERKSEKWLIKFIKNPEKLINRGDKYAVDLFKKYKQYMPDHDHLSDAEIKQILAYLRYINQ
jgi:mono/diheme cytochrome c family protein